MGVIGPEHPLPDGQGALEQGLGSVEFALVLEQDGQVVEAGGGVRVVGPQRLFVDDQSALEQGPGGVKRRPGPQPWAWPDSQVFL